MLIHLLLCKTGLIIIPLNFTIPTAVTDVLNVLPLAYLPSDLITNIRQIAYRKLFEFSRQRVENEECEQNEKNAKDEKKA